MCVGNESDPNGGILKFSTTLAKNLLAPTYAPMHISFKRFPMNIGLNLAGKFVTELITTAAMTAIIRGDRISLPSFLGVFNFCAELLLASC